jgi:predicted RNA-binding protein associated with RNAse of E/G family
MQIVIDIPEKYLNSNIIDVTLFTGANNTITEVNVEDEYAEFQVLPKGHGELIDKDVVLDMMNYGILREYITVMGGVIPADK